MSGFLYYVATNRLGYKEGVDLQFELDFDKNDSMLTVKLLASAPVAGQETPGAADAGNDGKPAQS